MENILSASNEERITLLIGAGCSASAGIPLASEIARNIRADLATKHVNLPETAGYADCMNALVTRQRHLYVKRICENAKINWAHIAIAQAHWLR
jgi:NAD-dependent SIR2 family protein deacetylase